MAGDVYVPLNGLTQRMNMPGQNGRPWTVKQKRQFQQRIQVVAWVIVHYLFWVYFLSQNTYWRAFVHVCNHGSLVVQKFIELCVLLGYFDKTFRHWCTEGCLKICKWLLKTYNNTCASVPACTSTITTYEEVNADDTSKEKTFFSFENLAPDECTTLTRKDYETGFVVLGKGNAFLVIENFSSRRPVEPHLKAFFNMLNKKKDGKLSEEEYKAGFLFFDAKNPGEIDKSSFYRTLALKVSDEFYGPRIAMSD